MKDVVQKYQKFIPHVKTIKKSKVSDHFRSSSLVRREVKNSHQTDVNIENDFHFRLFAYILCVTVMKLLFDILTIFEKLNLN